MLAKVRRSKQQLQPLKRHLRRDVGPSDPAAQWTIVVALMGAALDHIEPTGKGWVSPRITWVLLSALNLITAPPQLRYLQCILTTNFAVHSEAKHALGLAWSKSATPHGQPTAHSYKDGDCETRRPNQVRRLHGDPTSKDLFHPPCP